MASRTPNKAKFPKVVSIPYDGEEGFYNLYTGRSFEQGEVLGIEHIVPLSEGHDSGLCAASPGARQQFASDPFDLTVIPQWPNSEKGGRDLAEWLPEARLCLKTLQGRRITNTLSDEKGIFLALFSANYS